MWFLINPPAEHSKLLPRQQWRGFLLPEQSGEHSSQSCLTHDPRNPHCPFLLNELVSALRANDPDTFKRWLSGGVQDLGKPAVEELLLDWLAPFLSEDEKDRLIARHLGVSL